MITTEYISFVTSLLSSLLGLGDLRYDCFESYFGLREKITYQTSSSPCNSDPYSREYKVFSGCRSGKSCSYCSRY